MITYDNIIIIKFSIFFKFNFDSTKLIKKSIKKKLDFYKKYKELNAWQQISRVRKRHI